MYWTRPPPSSSAGPLRSLAVSTFYAPPCRLVGKLCVLGLFLFTILCGFCGLGWFSSFICVGFVVG
jgi:hypothetical protein